MSSGHYDSLQHNERCIPPDLLPNILLHDLKLCSSMTLFEAADPTIPVFAQVLEKFYTGKRDEKTLELL